MRPPSNLLMRGLRERTSLWSLGISGDLPIVLLRFEESEDLEILRQVLRAHEYWRMKQLAVDLVLLNERASSYIQDLQSSVEALVRASQAQHADDSTRGTVFTLRTDLVPLPARELLQLCRPGRAARPARQFERAARAAGPAKRARRHGEPEAGGRAGANRAT